jgi:hypothetical protein
MFAATGAVTGDAALPCTFLCAWFRRHAHHSVGHVIGFPLVRVARLPEREFRLDRKGAKQRSDTCAVGFGPLGHQSLNPLIADALSQRSGA